MQSEAQVADLQTQLVQSLINNQQLARENAENIKQNAATNAANYEERIKDLKEKQKNNKNE